MIRIRVRCGGQIDRRRQREGERELVEQNFIIFTLEHQAATIICDEVRSSERTFDYLIEVLMENV